MADFEQQSGQVRDIPVFKTQNQRLAVALMGCGCPPWNPREPAVNIYDEGHPFKPSPGNPRMPGVRGEVTYIFEETELLKELCGAWDAEVAAMIEEDRRADAAQVRGAPEECTKGTGEIDLSTPAGFMRFAARILKIEDDVSNWWRFLDPKIRVQKPGDVQRPDETHAIFPGFIIVSRNASAETLRKLGINPELCR